MNDEMKTTIRIIRRPELREITGLSDATVDRREAAGEFPRRRRIGVQSVGWLSDEVEQWMKNLPVVEVARQPTKTPKAKKDGGPGAYPPVLTDEAQDFLQTKEE